MLETLAKDCDMARENIPFEMEVSTTENGFEGNIMVRANVLGQMVEVSIVFSFFYVLSIN